jgi:uncharacterized OsmC-like protein
MAAVATQRAPMPINGVDTAGVFATIQAVRTQPELGKFTFRASNRWLAGTHSESRTETFSGAGAEHSHKAVYRFDADHPAVLVGQDDGPAPVEFLLYGLAACLTAGIANVAAARGVRLTAVESKVEGDIDLRAIFGITDEVRNGYDRIRISFRIAGDAPAEKLRAIVAQSRARSAVFDVLAHGTAVEVDVETL